MKIETLNLIIRDFHFTDDKDYYEFAKLKEVGRNAGWKPHTSIGVTRNIIASFIYQSDTFAIVSKKENKMIGTISLYNNTNRKNVNAKEIGFSINPKYQNKGYATEACKAILKYGFSDKTTTIISIACESTNIRSERVIMKCGFNYEGLIRQYRKLYNNEIIDAKIFSITKEEYVDERIRN